MRTIRIIACERSRDGISVRFDDDVEIIIDLHSSIIIDIYYRGKLVIYPGQNQIDNLIERIKHAKKRAREYRKKIFFKDGRLSFRGYKEQP